MNIGYNGCDKIGAVYGIKKKEVCTMCLFCKKKKKHTALKVVAIVFTSLAALAGLYVIFNKFFREKLLKKLGKGCAEEECAEIAAETEEADETVEAAPEVAVAEDETAAE